jgi:hypothetical protein
MAKSWRQPEKFEGFQILPIGQLPPRRWFSAIIQASSAAMKAKLPQRPITSDERIQNAYVFGPPLPTIYGQACRPVLHRRAAATGSA